MCLLDEIIVPDLKLKHQWIDSDPFLFLHYKKAKFVLGLYCTSFMDFWKILVWLQLDQFEISYPKPIPQPSHISDVSPIDYNSSEPV